MNIYQRRGVDNGFVWSDIFDSFDKLFADILEPSRMNSSITSQNFPPSDIRIFKETKDLEIRCALAGYKKDDLFVEFDDDRLKIFINKEQPSGTESKDIAYIQKGIKIPDKTEISFRIDTRFYDTQTTKVSFEDGLLVIRISPLEAVKPKKISLFGERKEPLKIEESKKECACKN